MGLFSKLFSREGEDSPEAEGQDAQAVPGREGEDGVTKSEESAAGGGTGKDARDARGRASSPDKPEASPPSAAGERAGARDAPPGSPKRAGPPPLERHSPDKNPKKTGDQARREPAPAAKPPPAAAGSANATAKLPVAPPAAPDLSQARRGAAVPAAPAPAAAKVAPSIDPQKNKPGSGQSHAAVSPPRTPQPTAVLPLEAAVDAAMAALIDPGHARHAAANDHHVHAHDQRAVAETFADMAKVHAHPLRELMFQLSVGRVPRQWAAACRPVLRPLFDAATQIGLLELVGALGAFDAALERAAAESTAFIGTATADALTAAYDRLRQQMPDAFTPPDRADSRRLILLESLLLQIPTFQRRTLAKLYSAGLSTLGQLGQAKAEEISAVAGIDHDLARTVVDHVQRFEAERNRINPAAMRSHLPERLRSIMSRLELLQSEFERAEAEDSADRKRTARNGREAAVLELDVAFAEVGEIDLIEELRRAPIRGKIERVESYLEQLQKSAQ